jgi:hypothetical protein
MLGGHPGLNSIYVRPFRPFRPYSLNLEGGCGSTFLCAYFSIQPSYYTVCFILIYSLIRTLYAIIMTALVV